MTTQPGPLGARAAAPAGERLDRFRRTPALRSLARETSVRGGDLVQPMFVAEQSAARSPIAAMPGIDRLGATGWAAAAEAIAAAGVPALILFGIPARKDAHATGAWSEDGVVQNALRNIRDAVPEVALIADVCLCEYTDHGHCRILRDGASAREETLEALAHTAVSLAEAGADVVAPSAMADGQVAAIREALDEAGFGDVAILSYAVKYASAFYGPFREAAGSAPVRGDRRAHQMDPANAREALREAEQDLAEGADALMVKPALACLDVLRAVRERCDAPLAAYSVSGEYAMVKAAAERGWIDERATVLETLGAIRRAGADFILTYHAREAAGWLTTSA
ncbi:MAG: porphobilinogen synthase [Gemmatimonadetes bacterium]|nr:porphobilinogen synthase [Gemmatimonadota bacterium]